MEADVAAAIREKRVDMECATMLHELANELSGGALLCTEVSSLCTDSTCNTSFHIRMSIPDDKWSCVVEISKLGRFAKCYWMKSFLMSKTYSDDPPTNAWSSVESTILELLRKIGVRLLITEELEEALPSEVMRDTPIGPAETVDDVLFYFDGRIV